MTYWLTKRNSLPISRIIVLFLLTCWQFAYSQSKINHNWNFGINAGITFNTTPPTAFQNSALNSTEGCASVSDDNGNLLFYSDGANIWDKNNQIMPNGWGIYGYGSAYQGVVIVPKPGNNQRYYVFTTTAQELNDKHLHYSEVDMTLNNGLGDVIATQKNIPLIDSVSEKITTVLHSNGLYIWVITSHMTQGLYYSFLVDCNGIQTTPIVSTSLYHIGDAIGEIIISPDGTKFASNSLIPKEIEYGNFNTTTGIVSPTTRFQLIDSTNTPTYAVSLSFSPNNQFLYALGGKGFALYQYDLSQINFVNSIQYVGGLAGIPNLHPMVQNRRLQLGPDNKIYVSQFYDEFLGVVHQPDLLGTNCQHVASAINLQGNKCFMSLPALVKRYQPLIDFEVSGNCTNSPTLFGIPSASSYDSLRWNFGDTASGALNYSNIAHPQHQYTQSGSYTVQLIKHLKCVSDTVYKTIVINEIPSLSYVNPPSCMGDTATFFLLQNSNDTTSATAQWIISHNNDAFQTSDSSFRYIFEENGNYHVQLIVNSNGCVDTNTVDFSISEKPKIDIITSPPCSEASTLTAVVENSTNEFYSTQWNVFINEQLVDTFHQNPIIVSNNETFTVELIVTTQSGCSQSISKELTLSSIDTNFQIPNVLKLSSNSDNNFINFQSIAPSFNSCNNYLFTIYNRWGYKVFEFRNDKNNPDINCNECFKGMNATGQKLSAGTYFYILQGENDFIRKGNITLFD